VICSLYYIMINFDLLMYLLAIMSKVSTYVKVTYIPVNLDLLMNLIFMSLR